MPTFGPTRATCSVRGGGPESSRPGSTFADDDAWRPRSTSRRVYRGQAAPSRGGAVPSVRPASRSTNPSATRLELGPAGVLDRRGLRGRGDHESVTCAGRAGVHEAYRFGGTFNARCPLDRDAACSWDRPRENKSRRFKGDARVVATELSRSLDRRRLRNWHSWATTMSRSRGAGRHPQSTACRYFLGPERSLRVMFGVRRIEKTMGGRPGPSTSRARSIDMGRGPRGDDAAA